MKTKKAPRANLEKRRLSHIIIGFIITLSLIVISFEWTSPQDLSADVGNAHEIFYEVEEMVSLPRDEPRPEKKLELPPLKEILEIVDNDVPVPEVVFDIEVTGKTTYNFDNPVDPGPEDLDDGPIDFILVEDKPLFNGGNPEVEFSRYIARHLIYPEIAAENGVSGRITVQFVIDRTGSLVDLVIVRGVDPALDAEALRVVSSSPKWTPGMQRGKPAPVRFTFPINFVLQ
ncbi:MAG: energy transducer TonB [Bacteroidetes bacterium]|nr:MAG: energy transducer TonB [Bacteroidota bacterium]